MSTFPSVSIVVLTYNARTFVAKCLTSALGQDYPDFELVVVDNASPDGTAEFVRNEFPQVRVIAAARNDGYGAGNNLGAANTSGEILAFLNPDAIPEPHWLRHLIGAMQRSDRQFATSMLVLQSDNQKLNSSGNLIHFLGMSYCRGVNAGRSTFDRPELVSGASGAAFAISRALFRRIAGFDETFFLDHDDVDLSLRALLAGERCLYVPDAVVAHDYELSLPPRKWGWIEAHRYAILFKVFDLRTLLMLVPALVLVDLMTLVYLALRGPDFVAAKLRSYVWILSHLDTIRDGRRRAQAVRAVTDQHILAVMTDRIAYEQLAPPVVSTLGHWLVDPCFHLYREVTLVFLGATCPKRWKALSAKRTSLLR